MVFVLVDLWIRGIAHTKKRKNSSHPIMNAQKCSFNALSITVKMNSNNNSPIACLRERFVAICSNQEIESFFLA